MKLKALVMLSSSLVLTVLIVCVSVYAYNAYATASSSGGSASVNGWALVSGTYSVLVKIDDVVEDHKHGPYQNGNNLSESATAPNPNDRKVYSEAYISGMDGGNQFIRTDYATYNPILVQGRFTHSSNMKYGGLFQ